MREPSSGPERIAWRGSIGIGALAGLVTVLGEVGTPWGACASVLAVAWFVILVATATGAYLGAVTFAIVAGTLRGMNAAMDRWESRALDRYRAPSLPAARLVKL